jgi:hypothetical protein
MPRNITSDSTLSSHLSPRVQRWGEGKGGSHPGRCVLPAEEQIVARPLRHLA